MATVDSLNHTMDDDITFEKVRHMPKRTQFVSTHRQLSWQHEKELKQQERDQRLSHNELSRAQTAMSDKFARLQGVKKQMERLKSGDCGRRHSAPTIDDDDLPDDVIVTKQKRETTTPVSTPRGNNPATPQPSLKHSKSTPSMKLIQFSPALQSPKQPSSPRSPTTKQPSFLSAPSMKHAYSASSLSVSGSVIPENSEVHVTSKPGAGNKGFKRTRMLSLTDTRDTRGGGGGGGAGNPSTSGLDADEEDALKFKERGAGRRATIAELVRPQPSNLPPHLLQKLEEFMSRTEAFLTAPSTARGSEDATRKADTRKDMLYDPSVFQRRQEEDVVSVNNEEQEAPV